MTEVSQLSPGTKCDRYDIVRMIGAGGMGEVYQAMHEFTKRQVALKVLKLAHAANAQHVEKMRHEAMLLCQIRHPNLVDVYDAGIAAVVTAAGPQSLIWMAMELLEGESLRERLVREGALRPALALEWAAQVADGIQAVHDANVVHRDLKPENIFIEKRGDIRVLDFGTATFDGMGEPQEQHARVEGTVPYMSPEQLDGEVLDGRSDVYALGLIVYEMLAGRHPFTDAQGGFPPTDQLLAMALTAEPESLAPFVGAAVWQVVARSLNKDRSARFGTMREAAAAFRQVAATYGTDASGVALRLSGATTQNPAGASLFDTGARPHAAAYSSHANMTPPPLAAGIPQEPAHGVTGGALATMAVVAAALGALLVVLVSRPVDVAPPSRDVATAGEHRAPTEDPRPSSGKAAAGADGPTDSPAPPTPSSTPEAPSATTSAPEPRPSPTPNVSPVPRVVPRPPPPPPPPTPTPKVPKPCNEIVCN